MKITTQKCFPSPSPGIDQRGFTLLETLVALTILAIGLLGLLGLQVAAMKGNASGFSISTAMALSEQRVEELRGLSTTSSLLNAGTHADGTVTVQAVVYSRSYVVQDDTPVSGVSTLTMTLSWTDIATKKVRNARVATRIVKG